MRIAAMLLALLATGCATAPAPKSAWAKDADALYAAMAAAHPGLYQHTGRQEFERRLAAYRRDPGPDAQLATARLAELVALAGDGHTVLPLLPLPFPDAPEGPRQRLLPLRFEWFDDGLFVVGADTRYRELVGGKVTALGGVEVSAALERVRRLLPRATPRFADEYAPEWLTSEIALRHAGVLRQEGSVTIETDRGSAAVALVSPDLSYDWLKGRSSGMTRDWISERSDDGPDLWSLAPISPGTIHWRITELRDREDLALAAASADVSSRARRLVLDLRDCIGGDGSLIEGLLAPLLPGSGVGIIALTGRRTHSACVMLVSALERRGGVRFIGQATGDAPNHYGETNLFVLPHAGVPVVHASRYWQTSTPDDRRPWRNPDVAVPFLHSDYAAGRDPALEKALNP